jgi:hypothetical protein
VQNEKVIKLINSEYELHPKSQLIDYYKLFFQGAFGPGHIILNKSDARKNLKIELEGSSIFEEQIFQDITYINNYCRVNINVINKGLITFNDFFNAFLSSIQIKHKITFTEWSENWKNIEKQIFKLKIPLANIELQSNQLWKIIKAQKLVSHSEIYHKTYSPHYRLFSAEQLQRIKC